MKMLLFEIKKIFSKPANKIALVILAAILIAMCFISIDSVTYVEEDGNLIKGVSAASRLREDKNKWAGYITEDVLKEVIKKNTEIINSEEYLSDDIQEQDKTYHKTQGYSDFRNIIGCAFTSFQGYDYYRIDSVTTGDVGQLYVKRISNLIEWLDTKESYSDAEKEFLINQYENLETPIYYEYHDGWETLLNSGYIYILFMLLALIIVFLVSGIFPNEFQLKSDSVFFSTKFGRNKAVSAKVGAGFLIITSVYWVVILFYTVIVLGALGFDGGECVIQTSLTNWKSFYNITYIQEFFLIMFGGYVGILFITLLSMLASALSRSSVLAIVIAFIFIGVAPFFADINGLSSVVKFFPDQLLKICQGIRDLNLCEIGGKVIGLIPILFIVYTVLFVLLVPILYVIYKRAELK